MENKKLLIFGICLLLVGCATAAQRQFHHNNEITRETNTQMKICRAAIFKKPENDILRKHLVHDALNKPTLAQLTDKTKATKEEIEALDRVQTETQECRKALLQSIATVTPSIVPIIVDEMETLDSNVLKLVKRKITWGQYNERAQALVVDSQKQVNEAQKAINTQLELSHEAELAQRQAATDAAINAMARLAVFYENERYAHDHHMHYQGDE